MYGVEGRWDRCEAFWISPGRIDTEIFDESGAAEGRSLSVMMPSSYSCRHCDADGHHTTVDTAIWFSFRRCDNMYACRRGACVTASSDVRVILAQALGMFLSDASLVEA